MFHGDYSGEVDYEDQDCLNNLIGNLRKATRKENTRNVSVRSDNKLGYKGVYFSKSNNRFIAQTTLDGKRVYIGQFKTAEEASNAYSEYTKDLHGVFAST
jgi:hypothetical protein